MHIHFLDPYRPRTSPLHSLDPRAKFILALAFILTAALTPEGAWPVYILLFAILLSVEIMSALGVGFVLKRSLLALPFVLAALPVVFTVKGSEIFRLPVGPWVLAGTAPGLESFVSVALKSWLSVQAAVLLASTTQVPDLLQAMRAVHIPRLLVAMFGLMWRYLFVLADEALRLMRARAARSGESGGSKALPRACRRVRPGGSLAWRARVAGGMAGSLFLRAFERSDRIYMAMAARGYDGEIRSLPLKAMPGSGRLTLVGGLVLLAALLLLGFLLRG